MIPTKRVRIARTAVTAIIAHTDQVRPRIDFTVSLSADDQVVEAWIRGTRTCRCCRGDSGSLHRCRCERRAVFVRALAEAPRPVSDAVEVRRCGRLRCCACRRREMHFGAFGGMAESHRCWSLDVEELDAGSVVERPVPARRVLQDPVGAVVLHNGVTSRDTRSSDPDGGRRVRADYRRRSGGNGDFVAGGSDPQVHESPFARAC